MPEPSNTIADSRTASKVCSLCRRKKPLTAFNRHRQRKNGLDSKCKQCNTRAGKEWYRRRQRETNRLYSTYIGMKGRCCSKRHSSFRLYGARGITVCKEWSESFEAFLRWAIQNGYRPGLQLDRIDNDKGYSPANCRFVTTSENMRNKRVRKRPLRNNARLAAKDVRAIKKLLADGVPHRMIARRFNVCAATVWAIKAGKTWAEVE